MNRNKLKKLHDFVKNKVKDDWFNLTSWVSDIDNFKAKECGTTACLFGWATVVFPDELRWIDRKSDLSVRFSIMLKDLNEQGKVEEKALSCPNFGNDTYSVAQHFFDITREQAMFLFSPNWYPMGITPRQDALERLKWFIEKAPEDFSITVTDAQELLIPYRTAT